jgi:hypothetical protein
MNARDEFRRTDLRAFELLGRAKRLVGADYWLFAGITAIGILIGTAVPLAILLGPMMCGIYMAYGQKERGEPVEFMTLFRGFDKFVDSLIASLLALAATLVVILPAFALYMLAVIGLVESDSDPSPLFLVVMVVAYGVMFFLSLAVNALFMFAYPLIVERDLGGWDAVRLSARAVVANLWGVVKLTLLNGLLGLAGLACCYVGVFLVLPLSLGAIFVAHREVFPLPEAAESGPETVE